MSYRLYNHRNIALSNDVVYVDLYIVFNVYSISKLYIL